MKIDGQNLAADLVQRMQEAHKSAKSDAATETFSVQTQNVEPASETKSPLESKLQETANAALNGEYKDADAIRSAVIEHIVDEKLSHLTTKRTERKKLVEGLERTLLTDPEFQNQVDDMLVMAARQIGAR